MNESRAEAIRNELLDQPYNSNYLYLSDKDALKIANRLHVHMSHEYTEWSNSKRPQKSLDPGMEATIGNLANYLIDKVLTMQETAPHTDFDPVDRPSHYNSHPSGIETILITEHETFLRGNILKYVLRAPYKGNELQDLEKAQWYLAREIDRVKGNILKGDRT